VTLGLPLSTLYAFLLVLARVAGFVIFIPIPGFRNAPEAVRLLFALAITFTLFPVWPNLPNQNPPFSQLAVWAFCEAGFGLVAGLAVAFLAETFQLGAQLAAFQAGYGFASTVDPNSQADSGILQVVASLSTGLLFFTTGFDHQLIRVLAASFEKFPAGSWAPASANLDGVVRLGGEMLLTGLRLAFPIVALLLLIDFALALLGRVQQQLQLLSLAFPAKMATALVVLAVLGPAVPRLFGAAAERTLAALWRSLGA
jgi:flagellar biosynthetic protein FliR